MPGTLGSATSAARGVVWSLEEITGQKQPSQLRANSSCTGFTTKRPFKMLHRYAEGDVAREVVSAHVLGVLHLQRRVGVGQHYLRGHVFMAMSM